jgi:hypothetical protein
MFVEVFGGLVFLSLLWIIPLHLVHRRQEKKSLFMKDRENYTDALFEYKKNPRNVSLEKKCIRLGDKFYSHFHPGPLNYFFNRRKWADSYQVRLRLIWRDMKDHKMEAA